MIEKIYLKRKNGLLRYTFTCPHCKAEADMLYLWIRLRFLIKGESKFYFHCPSCHKATAKRLMFNIVNDHTDKGERVMNGKKLWDGRIQ